MSKPRRPKIPGPSQFRLLLRYLAHRGDRFAVIRELVRKHGDYVRVRAGSRSFVAVSDPDAIRDILSQRQKSFRKGDDYDRLRQVIGDGIVTSEGEKHRRQRASVQHLFTRGAVESHLPEMVRQTRVMTSRWRAGSVLDVDLEMRKLTLSIGGRCLLGVDPAGSTDEILEAIETLFSDISSLHRIAFPFPKLIDALPLPGRRRTRKAQKTVARTLTRWMHEMSGDRRERRQDCLAAVAGELPQQVREGDPHLAEAFDTLMTILVSGVQTTAEALTAVWYLLALHPEVEDQLHTELDRVLAGGDLDAAAISRLTLLDDIQREALRLYPPVPGISRTPVEPVELGGHAFDETQPLGLIPLHMHRDERYYREPEAFRPCRWHRPEADSIPAGAYFPFGLGGRRCLGELFATLETSVVIATVAREWRLARAEDADLRLGLRTTLRPNFQARLESRR